MKKARRIYTAWILISILGFSYSVSSGSSILCLSDDGHSKIEQAIEPCCTVEPSELIAVYHEDNLCFEGDCFEANCHEDSDCGDCNDIEVLSLLSIKHNQKRSRDLTPILYNLISQLCLVELGSTSSIEYRRLVEPPFLTVSQVALRATILIC